MTLTQRLRQPITLILAFAFVLRLGYGILQDPLKPYDRAGTGGDEWWYLEFGYRQVVDVEMEPLSTAPLYVLMVLSRCRACPLLSRCACYGHCKRS